MDLTKEKAKLAKLSQKVKTGDYTYKTNIGKLRDQIEKSLLDVSNIADEIDQQEEAFINKMLHKNV